MDNIRRILVVHSHHSTRASRYDSVRRELSQLATWRGWSFSEVVLDSLPYYEAVKKVLSELSAGDLVVAAGGDGVAQVSFNAVYFAKAKPDVVFTTIPLGNGNDISRAFNGRHRAVQTILNQPVMDFYPLNVAADGKIVLSVASYVTFGATTVLVDYLNQDGGRRARQLLKSLTPAAAIPVTKLADISTAINQLEFPDFHRDGITMADDSIGFFLIPAAHNILRLPKDITMASSEFFFHHAATKDKNLAGKIIMAGAWTFHFPGQMTELEELEFIDNTGDIIANVSGDNVNLGPIHHLSAIRSTRSVKVLFNKH